MVFRHPSADRKFRQPAAAKPLRISFTCPAFARADDTGMPSMIMVTRPPATSASAAEGPPVYGTGMSLMPAFCCNSRPVRCVMRPTPETAIDSVPGAFFWRDR